MTFMQLMQRFCAKFLILSFLYQLQYTPPGLEIQAGFPETLKKQSRKKNAFEQFRRNIGAFPRFFWTRFLGKGKIPLTS